MTVLTLDEIRKKVAPIAKKYNLKAVFLFGSYARGQAREDSDIDLLYVKKDNSMSLLTKYQMLDELEDALEKSVDLVSLRAFEMNQNIPGTAEIEAAVRREKVAIYLEELELEKIWK